MKKLFGFVLIIFMLVTVSPVQAIDMRDWVPSLTEVTAPAAADLVLVLTDPGATKVDKKAKFNNLKTDVVVAGGTCSTSYAPDLSTGTMFTLTLNGACQLSNPTNLVAGKSFMFKLTQSSTTAPTFDTAYKWSAATQPTWSTSATKYDVFACVSFDGSTLQCVGSVDQR